MGPESDTELCWNGLKARSRPFRPDPMAAAWLRAQVWIRIASAVRTVWQMRISSAKTRPSSPWVGLSRSPAAIRDLRHLRSPGHSVRWSSWCRRCRQRCWPHRRTPRDPAHHLDSHRIAQGFPRLLVCGESGLKGNARPSTARIDLTGSGKWLLAHDSGMENCPPQGK